jgi:peptide/nickel transport system permease protein
VGESGSGKSIARDRRMGLLPPVARVADGVARFESQDLLRMPEAARRRLRGGAMAMIFQDPMSSLNPVHRVGDQWRKRSARIVPPRPKPHRGKPWRC